MTYNCIVLHTLASSTNTSPVSQHLHC